MLYTDSMKKGPVFPLSRNETVEIEITALGSDGQGIGRYGGFVVFVPFSIPGEIVRAAIIKVSANFAIGKLMEVLQASDDRIVPQCAVFGRCGGCQLQHLHYAAQLDFKCRTVLDALRKIGGVESPEVCSVIGLEDPWRYRNKGTFPVGINSIGSQIIGMYAPRSHRIVDVEDCPIQRVPIMNAVAAVRQWAIAHGITAYEEETGTGLLRGVMVRGFEEPGETLVVVIINGSSLPKADELVDMLYTTVPHLAGVVLNINKANTNVVLGPDESLLWDALQPMHSLAA
jgi:23S rRNA (uracil1939-C5)-methyltransferase